MSDERILLGHGSGGRMMHRLIREVMAPAFAVSGFGDAALLPAPAAGRLAFTTDGYVVSPVVFPGGDIGELAVNGTVNDLAVSGARPHALSAGFVLEEGLPLAELRRIVASMARAAREAGVAVVAGDTKVVGRGSCDKLFITTAGIGVVPEGRVLSAREIRPGDAVLVSGHCGSHGVAVMAERNGLTFEPPVLSDTAALNGLTEAMFATGAAIRVMRDPTRGGLATTLKEFALESGRRILVREAEIPVLPGVRGACDLLGLDPLYVANEGILIALVAPEEAATVLAAMRAHPRGRDAALIGEVRAEQDAKVLLQTAAAGTRILDMLPGEQLPRIC
ncbi:MAG TPA: hydrogenase expression/formation protein HypE [Candidatus Methanoperedens sp.]|nr:hydrogenase expression/formation protein HypE [Candidatus Methanoperedens sp.]